MSSIAALTQNLHETLAQSRAILDDWVKQERRAADAQAAAAVQQLAAEQRAVDAASAQLLAVQLESGCHVQDTTDGTTAENRANASAVRLELEQKVQHQTVANARLDALREDRNKQLEEVIVEHKHQKARADAAHQQASLVAASKETTVNDLTRGIYNYKFLGLDFEKAEYERLRFSFTQLDAAQPDQKFSFCLEATDDELWSVVECEPIVLADEKVDDLLAPLNDTNDMKSFVRGMRRAFLEHIRGEA